MLNLKRVTFAIAFAFAALISGATFPENEDMQIVEEPTIVDGMLDASFDTDSDVAPQVDLDSADEPTDSPPLNPIPIDTAISADLDFVALDSLTLDQVQDLQAHLNRLGFSAGRVDGQAGKQTRKAIVRWAKSKGKDISGPTGDGGRVFAGLLQTAGNAAQEGTRAACGHYVLFGCKRTRDAIADTAAKYSARIIWSSSADFPNFNAGFYCAVIGPMSFGAAKAYVDGKAKRMGAKSAYAKNAC